MAPIENSGDDFQCDAPTLLHRGIDEIEQTLDAAIFVGTERAAAL